MILYSKWHEAVLQVQLHLVHQTHSQEVQYLQYIHI